VHSEIIVTNKELEYLQLGRLGTYEDRLSMAQEGTNVCW
jgi:hypothetical protein